MVKILKEFWQSRKGFWSILFDQNWKSFSRTLKDLSQNKTLKDYGQNKNPKFSVYHIGAGLKILNCCASDSFVSPLVRAIKNRQLSNKPKMFITFDWGLIDIICCHFGNLSIFNISQPIIVFFLFEKGIHLKGFSGKTPRGVGFFSTTFSWG